MLTAACALRLGMEPILVLKPGAEPAAGGNLLLNRLMGVQVRFLDTDSYQDVYREMDRIARQREAQGDKCYQIPVGGSVPWPAWVMWTASGNWRNRPGPWGSASTGSYAPPAREAPTQGWPGHHAVYAGDPGNGHGGGYGSL